MANYNLFDAASLVMIPTGTKDGKLYSIKPEPVYGSELIALSANRDFSSNTGFWTFESPQVTYGTGNVDFNTSLTNYGFYKTSFLVPNKSYTATFDIVNYTSGAVHVNGGGLVYGSVNSNGTHRISLNSNANGTFAIQSDSGGAVLSIDNISIKEILVGDGDFTFSRGSNLAATRVGADGLIEKGRENLFTNSNNFGSTSWVGSVTETSGQSGYNGTNDAWLIENAANGAYIRQNNTSSGVLTASVYAKAGNVNWLRFAVSNSPVVSVYFDLVNGVSSFPSNIISETIVSVGNGWYRLSATFLANSMSGVQFYPADGANDLGETGDNIFLQDAQLQQGLVATDYITSGATTGTAGILENTPRFDYSNGASCPSFLLEPSRLNNILYSENVTTTWWLKSNVTALDNQGISPEGLNNAGKITLTSTGAAVLYKTSLTIGNGVLSFFAKPGTLSGGRVRISVDGVGAADWNLDGTINSVSGGTAEGAENYGNGWFRYSYNVPSGSVANYGVQGGVIGESMLVYGMQVEPNATYPTSYIPTYGTSQTRAGEVCGGAGDANTFNSTEGVLYAEAKTFSITGSAGIISLSNGTTSNRVTIELDGANIKVRFVVGGSSIGIFNYAINIKETLKIAAKYKANDFALWVNGTERVAITSGSSFSNNTLSELSFDRGDGNEIFLGNVKQVITFNTALTDTELATLTTL